MPGQSKCSEPQVETTNIYLCTNQLNAYRLKHKNQSIPLSEPSNYLETQIQSIFIYPRRNKYL